MSTLVASVVLLAMSTSLAHAHPADDCNQVRDRDRQLRGCTAYIQSGKADPQNLATAHLNRGITYAQRGQQTKALADFDTAGQLDPGDPLVPYNLGNVYFDAGQYERAIQAYTRAISLDESFALAYFNRGAAPERRGKTTETKQDFRRALELDPNSELARRRLQRVRTPKANAAAGGRGTVP